MNHQTNLPPSVILAASDAIKPHTAWMPKDDPEWRGKLAEAAVRAGLNEMNRLHPPIHKKGLTVRQLECLKAIKTYIKKNEYAPSFEEVAITMGLNRANVNRLVGVLVDKGHVTHIPGSARSLALI